MCSSVAPGLESSAARSVSDIFNILHYLNWTGLQSFYLLVVMAAEVLAVHRTFWLVDADTLSFNY